MTRITFDNEKEIRLKSFAGAVAINVLLLVLLLFVQLQQTVPDPPPIEFIEVNFGTDARGSGKIQTYNKASDSPNPVDVKAAEKRPNPEVTTTPRLEKTTPTPSPKVENVKVSKTSTEKPVITSKVESPVTEAERPEPKRVESPKPAAPVERPAPPAPPKKVETVNNDALFKKSSGGGGSNGTVGKAAGTGGNNNGDDASGVGDKGNPNGKIDAKSLYGKPGGGNSGVALNVSGWAFGTNRLDKDDSDEGGKIIYQVRVDEDGNIVSARPIQQTVSPAVEAFYRRQVTRFKLRPKGGSTPSGISTGTLTVNISSN